MKYKVVDLMIIFSLFLFFGSCFYFISTTPLQRPKQFCVGPSIGTLKGMGYRKCFPWGIPKKQDELRQ